MPVYVWVNFLKFIILRYFQDKSRATQIRGMGFILSLQDTSCATQTRRTSHL